MYTKWTFDIKFVAVFYHDMKVEKLPMTFGKRRVYSVIGCHKNDCYRHTMTMQNMWSISTGLEKLISMSIYNSADPVMIRQRQEKIKKQTSG